MTICPEWTLLQKNSLYILQLYNYFLEIVRLAISSYLFYWYRWVVCHHKAYGEGLQYETTYCDVRPKHDHLGIILAFPRRGLLTRQASRRLYSKCTAEKNKIFQISSIFKLGRSKSFKSLPWPYFVKGRNPITSLEEYNGYHG